VAGHSRAPLQELVVRDGKGRHDRTTMLPIKLRQPLATHLAWVKRLHETDLAAGAGAVALPDALRRKYPNAAQEWGWQWVFPATRHYVDRETGERRRHHLHEDDEGTACVRWDGFVGCYRFIPI